MRTSSARTLMGCIPNKAPTRVQEGYNDLMKLDSLMEKQAQVDRIKVHRAAPRAGCLRLRRRPPAKLPYCETQDMRPRYAHV